MILKDTQRTAFLLLIQFFYCQDDLHQYQNYSWPFYHRNRMPEFLSTQNSIDILFNPLREKFSNKKGIGPSCKIMNYKLVIKQSTQIFIYQLKYLSMGNQCLDNRTVRKWEEKIPEEIFFVRKYREKFNDKFQNRKKKWELLEILKKILKDTCLTSGATEQLATILSDLFLKIAEIDSKKSKEKVDAFFEKDLLIKIKDSQEYNYNKLLTIYISEHNIQNISREEESRILHIFYNSIQIKNRNQKNYHEKIDELVELECIEGIMEKGGDKLNFLVNQLKVESDRMKQMLKQTFKKFQKQFSELQYDLQSRSDFLLAAEISKYACQYHENGIYFLIVYFNKCFDKPQSKRRKVKEIEEMAVRVLNELGEKYKPGQKLKDKYKESIDAMEPTSKISIKHNQHEFKGGNKSDQLQNIIITQAKSAEYLMEKFEKLISECCLKNSLWSKTNLKINPNSQNKKAIFRVVEKLLFKKNESNKNDYLRSASIQQMLEQEEKQYKKRIQQVLKNKDTIQFTITDMLRAKCIFLTLDDIQIAIVNIKEFVSNNKEVYQIVEIENRLKDPISDFTIKILINDHQGHKLVAQLQLSLQSNFANYNFAHKIYQFVRSKMFTKIKTLKNYFQEYRGHMEEMIIGQLQNEKEFSLSDRNKIMSYFSIEKEDNSSLSLDQALNNKIYSLKRGYQFIKFEKKFKYAQPLMNMVLYRKLGMIDHQKVEMTKRERNESVKDMMILQPYEILGPLHQHRGNKQMLSQSTSVRNQLILSRLDSYRNYAFDLTSRIFGKLSLQKGKQFLQLAIQKQHQTLEPENAKEYYLKAKECFQKMKQKDIMLKFECDLRFLIFQFTSGRVQRETFVSFENLSKKMKENKNYINPIIIQLLISEFHLIRQNNYKLFQVKYDSAKEMSRIHGIPFSNPSINDIQWRIWEYQFFQEKASDKKVQIFKQKLCPIISNFGAYKRHEEISKILDRKLFQQMQLLELSLPSLIPNRFSTHLHVEKLTETDWKVLMQSQFHNLTSIRIKDSDLDEGKLLELHRCIAKWTCPKLEQLKLNNNKVTNQGVMALTKANWPIISIVQLNNNLITDEGIIEALSLADWPYISTLRLNRNHLTDKSIKALIKAKWLDLSTLQLNHNKITDQGVKALARAEWSSSLYFKRHRVSDQEFMKVSKTNWPKLSTLQLSYNQITDQGVKALVKIYWKQLRRLNLSNNQITDQGIKALTEANWPELSILQLNNNRITDEGIKDLTSTWPSLFTLCLASNQITDEGVKTLTNARLQRLLTLNLSGNKIQEKEQMIKKKFPNIKNLLLDLSRYRA